MYATSPSIFVLAMCSKWYQIGKLSYDLSISSLSKYLGKKNRPLPSNPALNSRIDLIDGIIPAPHFPLPARFLHHLWYLCARDPIALLQLVPALQNGNVQPHTRMPRDVAMIAPSTWIVRLELNDQMPVASLHVRVAASGIVRIDNGVTVPRSGAFGENLL